MKYFILLLIVILPIIGITQPLSVLFHENMEQPSGCDSMVSSTVSSGSPDWNINGSLYASPGIQSIHGVVGLGVITSLVSGTFSTIGQDSVVLKFRQICKIEFTDMANIEVSENGGVTWTTLTGSEYLGTGLFQTNGNRFASNSYWNVWLPNNYSALPLNTWWKEEVFNVSSLVANKQNVKFRFRLADGGWTGPNQHYGWLLDNIQVEGYELPLSCSIQPSDTTICPGLSVQLNSLVSYGTGNYTYSWTSDPPGFVSNQPNVVVSPVVTTEYKLVVTDGTNSTTALFVIYVVANQNIMGGTIAYLNDLNSILPGVQVELFSGVSIVASTTTDLTGNFQYGGISPGTYTLKASGGPPWGGVNALDALNVAKHYLNMDPLSGLFLQSADVNADLMVNSVDALLVLKRYVGMQNSFPAGDWVFEEKMVTLGCSGITTETLHVLCTGDTNGSWQP
jgi:hypothetical protein